ncbi:MAG: cellulase family glycosylhydrolase [Candidatus Sumerlaeota bacterium]|nr:cellulase family glycosylhydrolase [Candidatus Sumerlaeota bacterium]
MPAADLDSPYGICGHMSWLSPEEAERTAQMMQDMGAKWVRSAFSWSECKGESGGYDWSKMDQVLDTCERHGLQYLPLLGGMQKPKHACENLEEWTAFVRAGVQRYGERLPYWEVWNEPNLEKYWGREPSPGDYMKALKATYAAVKEANPNATVTSCGFAYNQKALDYIRECYQNWLKDACDILNVHIYVWGSTKTLDEAAAAMMRKMADLKALMKEFGDAEKPIWVTETGWPLAAPVLFDARGFAPAALEWAGEKVLGPSKAPWPLEVWKVTGQPDTVDDADALLRSFSGNPKFAARAAEFSEGAASLQFPRTQIVVIPTGNAFPPDIVPALERFCTDGGLVVHFGGIPFYQTLSKTDGTWETKGAGNQWRERFGVRFLAFFTDKTIPKEIRALQPAPDLKGDLSAYLAGERFLDVAAKAQGVKLTPCVECKAPDGRALYPAALFTYSDRKGGFFSSTFKEQRGGATEEYQARAVPLAYRTLREEGAAKVFWYEFRTVRPGAGEGEFGLVNKDFSPKPAYEAYKKMTSAAGK